MAFTQEAKKLIPDWLNQDCGGPLYLGPKFAEEMEAIFSFKGTSVEAEMECTRMGMIQNSKLP